MNNKYTKDNISDAIEIELNKLNLKFIKDNSSDDIFDIFIGSVECHIQVDKSRSDDSFNLQFFDKVDDDGESNYLQEIASDENFDLQCSIEELIDWTKQNFKIINKIKSKIDQIIELCEENELNVERFITIKYDFAD